MSEEQEKYTSINNKTEKYSKKEWNLVEAVQLCQEIITQDEYIHKIQINTNNYVYVVPEEFYVEIVKRNHQILSTMEEQG